MVDKFCNFTHSTVIGLNPVHGIIGETLRV